MPSAFSADYNFSAAAAGEELLHGAARPGAKSQLCYAEDLRVPAEDVQEWVQFMRARGIKRVISLLSESELQTYAEPGLVAAMQAAFPGGAWTNVDVKADAQAGPAAVLAALDAAAAAGDKAVIHCWGGGGRTGLYLAAFLVLHRGMSPAQAQAAVEAQAAAAGCSRRVDGGELAKLVGAAGAQQPAGA